MWCRRRRKSGGGPKNVGARSAVDPLLTPLAAPKARVYRRLPQSQPAAEHLGLLHEGGSAPDVSARAEYIARRIWADLAATNNVEDRGESVAISLQSHRSAFSIASPLPSRSNRANLLPEVPLRGQPPEFLFGAIF
jgi:hypothetical protein